MTTIAYDGNYLAADSRSCVGQGGIIGESKVKIFINDNYIVGLSGKAAESRLLVQYLNGDIKLEYGQLEGGASLLVVERATSQAFYMANSLELEMIDTPAADGSGADYALGAMLHGADAVEAVEIASKLDAFTNNEIRVVNIKEGRVRKV